ncbi:MAG TPA: DHA2 family efflux MFS transporter permease subunit [Bryobacteraceae bacterium]|jgi:DHA2 family multidrug resistance protein|nr:DHA2 family efflux MFS transporter permease subunit [Bryobacteraceae bacterium]
MAESSTVEASSPEKTSEEGQIYAPWKPRFNPWTVALTVTLATFMEVLDTSIANVALPHIAGGLSASQDEATWVLTSYLVSNAVVLPISAWLSVLVGRKRFYMACVAMFTVSSFLCGLAPTLGMLVAFRVMQGLGGGGLATSEQAILADTFSPEKRGMAFAIYGMAVVMAPAIGPTLGGWITDNYSWRWIFYLNVPVGILSLYLTHKIVEDPPYMESERLKMLRNSIDYVGLALIGVGIGCLQIVLDKGQEEDWFSSRMIVTMSLISAVSLAFFIRNEWRHSNPILDIHLLQQKNFATAAFMMFVLGVVLFGTTVLIPQFLQILMGYSAQSAGEALSLGAVLLIFMMPIVGQLVSRVDPRYLIFAGFLATALALFHMTTINLQIDFRTAAMYRVYQVLGLAFIFIPINTLSYVGVPRHKNNQVAGITNLARNLGGSVGISMLSTFLLRRQQAHQVYLMAHASSGNPVFTQQVAALSANFMRQGSPPNVATQQAYALLERSIGAQATTLSYIDIISVGAILVACLAPFAFLMQKPLKGAAPVAAH